MTMWKIVLRGIGSVRRIGDISKENQANEKARQSLTSRK